MSEQITEWINRRDVSDSKLSHQHESKVVRLVQDISSPFNIFFTALIVVNAAYIGVETDFSSTTAKTGWFLAETSFMILFTAELAVRLYALRIHFFRDGWNIFDLFLVTVAIV